MKTLLRLTDDIYPIYANPDGTLVIRRGREGEVTPNGNPVATRWGLWSRGELQDFDIYCSDLAERNNIQLCDHQLDI